jgi:hypothetical protein
MNSELSQEKIDAINQALFSGRFIEAIKIYRTGTGSGLKEAKDFIEALETRLRAEVPERFTAPPRLNVDVSTRGCAAIAFLIAAAIAGAVLLLR